MAGNSFCFSRTGASLHIFEIECSRIKKPFIFSARIDKEEGKKEKKGLEGTEYSLGVVDAKVEAFFSVDFFCEVQL